MAKCKACPEQGEYRANIGINACEFCYPMYLHTMFKIPAKYLKFPNTKLTPLVVKATAEQENLRKFLVIAQVYATDGFLPDFFGEEQRIIIKARSKAHARGLLERQRAYMMSYVYIKSVEEIEY